MAAASNNFKYPYNDVHQRMLILSCRGGGGHLAAEAAISSIFESAFEIQKMYPVQEIRVCRRPFIEECYNYMLRKGFVRTASLVARFAAPIFSQFSEKCSPLKQRLESRLDEFKPDIIVSVAPLINAEAIRVASMRNIPYLLVTTDHHVGNWFPGGRKVAEGKYRLLKVTVGADLPTSKGLLMQQGINEESIEVTGFPIRKEFSEEKPGRIELCTRLGIPYDKKIILIMMGGAGSPKSVAYAQKLLQSRLSHKIHVVVICGTDKESLHALKEVSSPSLTPLGFVKNVSDYMSVANLLITKPGPGTVAEAEHLGVPMIIDQIADPVFWEKPIPDYVENQKLGTVVRNEDEIVETAAKLFRKNKHALPVKNPSTFNKKIVGVVEELLKGSALRSRS